MGFLDALSGFKASPWGDFASNTLSDLGYGLTRGTDLNQGFQYATQRTAEMAPQRAVDAQQRKVAEDQAKQQTLTDVWMQKTYPQWAGLGATGVKLALAAEEQKMNGSGGPGPIEINGQLVDPATGKVIGDYRDTNGTAPQNPFMSAGDGRFFNWQTQQYVTDPNAPPPAADQKQTLLNEQKDVATGTILGAASKARALGKGWNVGMGGASLGMNPESDAAELRRQVAVLKSKATIENLSAMRQASPTGGALGAVSDSENAMLASAAGAIDPNASEAQFQAAVDNYELTLLQIVHGPVAGKKIFDQTRNGEAYVPPSSAAPGGTKYPGVTITPVP